MIYVSVFFISAAVLALEIAWMRVLVFMHWYHVASMVISLAMLGFAASGAYLSFWLRGARPFPRGHYALLSTLFAGSIPVGYLALQRLPLQPFLLLYDLRQWTLLLLFALGLFVPYLLGAICIGMLFGVKGLPPTRVYGVNLLGSATGVLAAVVGMFFASGRGLLLCAAALAVAGSLLVSGRGGGLGRGRIAYARLVPLPLLLLFLQPVRVSPHKPLAKALALPGARVVEEARGPWGEMHVVEAPAIRSLPGLSLQFEGEIPRGSRVFVDGDAVGARLLPGREGREALNLFDASLLSLPYTVLDRPKVLVVGAGAGVDALQACWWKAEKVTLVGLHPDLLRSTGRWLAERVAGWEPRTRIELLRGGARRMLVGSPARYDLVVLNGLGAQAASLSGVQSFRGNRLLTVEGLVDLESSLTEEGLSAAAFWIDVPPRQGLKLAATFLETLRRRGVEEPREHLFMARDWSAGIALLFRAALTPERVTTLRRFCDRNGFDLVYCPGMSRGEANRRHRWESPIYHDAVAEALGEGGSAFLAGYPFQVQPATDDRPYFGHFFTWPGFVSLRRALGWDGVLLREWGYLTLWATLAAVLTVGGLFIGLPLWGHLRRLGDGAGATGACRGRAAGLLYFGLVGCGFMSYEMLFMEASTPLVDASILSVSLVLAAVLAFSSLGSLTAERMLSRARRRTVVLLTCLLLAGVGPLYAWLLPPLLYALPGTDLWQRLLVCLVLLAPPCFLMGIPFPTGMTWIRERVPDDVGVCWGINGWTSVLFAAATPLLAIHLGLAGAFWVGGGVYLVAGCTGAFGLQREGRVIKK